MALSTIDYIYIGAGGGGGVLLLIVVAGIAVGLYFWLRSRTPRYQVLRGDEESAVSGVGVESVNGRSNGRHSHPNSHSGLLPTTSSSRLRASMSVEPDALLQDYIEEGIKAPHPEQQMKQREEAALLIARYYLRSSNIKLEARLSGMGSRKRKFSFLVHHPQRGKLVLSLVSKGIHCAIPFMSDSGKATFCNLLQSIKHPYIYPTVEADYLVEKDNTVILRTFQSKGSLKDLIYRSSPRNSYIKKYSVPGSRVKETVIALYGRQILEGLAFLHSKGVPYGHLHSGNVMLDNGVCRLSEYENALINVVPRLQPFYLLLPDRHPDVVAFGHILYEMTFGREPELRAIPLRLKDSKCPASILPILEGIFGADGMTKPSLKTVEELLSLPFFSLVQLPPTTIKKTRIDSKGLEMLKIAQKASVVGKEDLTLTSSRGGVRIKSVSSDALGGGGSPGGGGGRRNSTSTTSRRRKKQTASSYKPSSRLATTASKSMSPPTVAIPPSSAPSQPRFDGASTTPGASETSSPMPTPDADRSRLLDSISGFSKAALRPTATNDRSKPIL